MPGFDGDEEFDSFAKKFTEMIANSNQVFEGFEKILKRHPRFVMERRREDFYLEIQDLFRSGTSWTPEDASLAIDLTERQISYYAKCTNGPSWRRVKRAAYYETGDHEAIAALKGRAEEIFASLPPMRSEIGKWAAEFDG